MILFIRVMIKRFMMKSSKILAVAFFVRNKITKAMKVIKKRIMIRLSSMIIISMIIQNRKTRKTKLAYFHPIQKAQIKIGQTKTIFHLNMKTIQISIMLYKLLYKIRIKILLLVGINQTKITFLLQIFKIPPNSKHHLLVNLILLLISKILFSHIICNIICL